VKPEPVTVTDVPAGPEAGLRTILGSTVNAPTPVDADPPVGLDVTLIVYVPDSDPTPTLNLATEIAPALSVQAIVTIFKNTPVPGEPESIVIVQSVSAPVMVCPAVMVTVVPALGPTGGEPVVGASVRAA
jgi:hypothetical protein